MSETANVYTAEAAFRDKATDFPERHFESVTDIQRYADAILAMMDYPEACRVEVVKDMPWAQYHGPQRLILIPDNDWGKRESVVLHELAHHCAGLSGHGPQWRVTYVDMVRRFMGSNAEGILKKEFWKRGLE